MRYEIRLFQVGDVVEANRRASSTGAELETALGDPDQVLTFDSLSDAAAAMGTLPSGLTPMVYEVDDGGRERPVSVMELARASASP